MNIAHDAPKRPALRYYGGKWNLALWIISHFPPHKNYVEPCGGAASVLLKKPRSPLETYNDLDGNVVNFFRVLRDRPDELIRAIRLTPWARAEYQLSLEPVIGPMPEHDRTIEQARRYFVSLWMSMQGGHASKTSKTWRMSTSADRWGFEPAEDYTDITEKLYQVAFRFRGVQIENRAADYMIQRYDNPAALIYFDPPYVKETRTQNDVYRLEVDNAFHIEAADLLRAASGFVVVSGYACPLYTDLYEAHSWHRVDKEAQTNNGGKRIESLWLSPRTWEALTVNMAGLPLFAAR